MTSMQRTHAGVLRWCSCSNYLRQPLMCSCTLEVVGGEKMGSPTEEFKSQRRLLYPMI